MEFARVACVVLLGMVTLTASASPARGETHWDLQTVDSAGVSSWSGSYPFTLVGVILNNPEDMLDGAYDENASAEGTMGAQWQIVVQGVDTDRCGTALWMGQNYSSLGPWVPAGNAYDRDGWNDEMDRLNYDATTGHHFRAGDLVEVTANASLFYGGKRNVNEAHRVTPDKDFSISLITADYGLPTPERLTLGDLYASPGAPDYDPAYPMFDRTRATGAEHYQGMYVLLTGLTLTNAGGWDGTEWADRLCEVTDGLGHTLPLRMPLHDLGDAPAGVFDAYGILNQESGSGSNGRMGYELFVTGIVPEPASLSLLVIGALACLRRRDRRTSDRLTASR